MEGIDLRYRELTLKIGARRLVDGRYPASLQLDRGETLAETSLPGELGAWSPGEASSDEGLFALIFGEPELEAALERAKAYCPLRCILELDDAAAELHALPWEGLCQRQAGGELIWLAADAATPFSRYRSSNRELGRQISSPLRLLLAVAAPNEDALEKYQLAPIDAAAEWQNLWEALSDFRQNGQLEIELLEGPISLGRLQAVLSQPGYDALHLICHGRNPEHASELFLHDDQGETQRIGRRAWREMFDHLRYPPRLVVLASCHSASLSLGETFRGFVPDTIAAGATAVVAMQGQIPQPSARSFGSMFYRQLLQHGRVDLACNEARRQLIDAGLRGAALPVLYLRQCEGRLLRPAPLEDDGRSVYLSYEPEAIPLAKEWATWLRQEGFRPSSLSADAAELTGLAYFEELALALKPCRVVIAFLHQQLGQRQTLEIAAARARGRTVIVISREPEAVLPDVLDDCPIFDARNPQASRLGLHDELLSCGLLPTTSPTTRDPFPGHRSYLEAEAGIFFGREAEIGRWLDRLRVIAAEGSNVLCLLHGPSGCGKTSFLRAGLLPRLRSERRSYWLLAEAAFCRGEAASDPMGVLAAALAASCPPAVDVWPTREMWHFELTSRSPADAAQWLLNRLAAERFALCLRNAIVWPIDALDAIKASPGAAVFLDFLAALTRRPSIPFLVIATLRDHVRDDLEQQLVARGLRPWCQALAPLDAAALTRILCQAAAVAEVSLDPPLIASLLEELGKPGSLALWALLLRELFEHRQLPQHLDLEGFHRAGGLPGLLARQLEDVLARSSVENADRVTLAQVLPQFATLDHRGQLIPQPMPAASIAPADWPWLEILIDGRLLVLEGPLVGLAHPALLAACPEFEQRLREEIEPRRLAHRVAMMAEDWQRRSCSGELLSRRELRKIAAFDLKRWSELERNFLAASEKFHGRRWLVRWAASFLGLTGLTVGAIVLRVWGLEGPVEGLRGLAKGYALVGERNVAYNSDGTKIAGSDGLGRIYFWEPENRVVAKQGLPLLLFNRQVAFMPDDSLVTLTGFGELVHWQGNRPDLIASFGKQPKLVAKNGRLAVCADRRANLSFWDNDQFDWPRQRKVATVACEIAPDLDLLFYVDREGSLHSVDFSTGVERAKTLLAKGIERMVYLQASRELVYTQIDEKDRRGPREIVLFDLARGTPSRTGIQVDRGSLLRADPSGRRFAFSRNHELVVYTRANHATVTLPPPAAAFDQIRGMDFHPLDQGLITTISYNGCMRVWDLVTRRETHWLEAGCPERIADALTAQGEPAAEGSASAETGGSGY